MSVFFATSRPNAIAPSPHQRVNDEGRRSQRSLRRRQPLLRGGSGVLILWTSISAGISRWNVPSAGDQASDVLAGPVTTTGSYPNSGRERANLTVRWTPAPPSGG